nr:uncharacterized protein LOC128695309 [Cherax quadricarinatus]
MEQIGRMWLDSGSSGGSPFSGVTWCSSHYNYTHSLPSIILTRLSEGGKAAMLVETGRVFSQDQLAPDQLLQGLWGDTRTTCRGLIVDLSVTSVNNTQYIFRLVEESEMWKLSKTIVVVVGGRAGVKDALLHHSLRNTPHALYLALHDNTLHDLTHHDSLHLGSRIEKALPMEASGCASVWVYRRCLYCNKGDADVQLVLQNTALSFFKLHGNLFPDEFKNFMSHKYLVVALRYFPYMDYQRHNNQPGTTVTPTDSLDFRILSTLTSLLNFTYEMHEQREFQWGVPTNGKFNGMIGELQREESDFCMIAAPTPERLQAIDYTKGYTPDVMIVLSLRPTLLPENLSLIRPFTGELWLVVMASVVGWGTSLWLLQKVWQWAAGGQVVKFTTSLLYSWGALLNIPPSDPSVNVSGQILVGFWLLFCLVITTGYNSSLIAHLSVQGKSKTIEGFRDLVERDNWKWGSEGWFMTGVPLEYFSKHTDPMVKKIYEDMELLKIDEAFRKVLKGGYSFISFKNYAKVIIASSYTDTFGNTPLYIGKEEIPIFVVSGWGFRKGAPFHSRFSQLIFRLEDTGIISYWNKEVMARRVRENRAAAAEDSFAVLRETIQEERKEVVLGLGHLQGAFYLLLLGSSTAFFTLLGEHLNHRLTSPK